VLLLSAQKSECLVFKSAGLVLLLPLEVCASGSGAHETMVLYMFLNERRLTIFCCDGGEADWGSSAIDDEKLYTEEAFVDVARLFEGEGAFEEGADLEKIGKAESSAFAVVVVVVVVVVVL